MGSAERLAAKIMIMSHQEKNEFISLLVIEYRTEKEENQKLKAQLEIAKETVEYYADLKIWKSVTVRDLPQLSNRDDIELTDKYEDYYCWQGGKKAREALAKLEGME